MIAYWEDRDADDYETFGQPVPWWDEWDSAWIDKERLAEKGDDPMLRVAPRVDDGWLEVAA